MTDGNTLISFNNILAFNRKLQQLKAQEMQPCLQLLLTCKQEINWFMIRCTTNASSNDGRRII